MREGRYPGLGWVPAFAGTLEQVHVYGLSSSIQNQLLQLLGRVGLIEMTRPVLAKALEPLPAPLRTLDGLHLATMDFLRRRGDSIELASYDNRLVAAAQVLGIPLAAL